MGNDEGKGVEWPKQDGSDDGDKNNAAQLNTANYNGTSGAILEQLRIFNPYVKRKIAPGGKKYGMEHLTN